MVDVSVKRSASFYPENSHSQNMNKKGQDFLNLESKNGEAPSRFFPNEGWNQPIGQDLKPVDYTNTASDPNPPSIDPTMSMLNTPMLPLDMLQELMQLGFDPSIFMEERPITAEDVKPNFLATENNYRLCIPDYDRLTEEQRDRIMASALLALASSKTQQGSFSYPGQAIKPPDFFSVGEKIHKIGCSFTHGVVSDLESSQEYAGIISGILDGHQVKGCHWQFMAGFLKHLQTSLGLSNPNIKGVMKLFNDHFDKYGEDAPYILICHSEGANTTNQALKRIPEERRKNIHIISVGPAKYIDPKLCGSVFNIVNNNDNIAKKVDKKGYNKAVEKGNIEIVREDPSVGLLDAHSFKNPKTLDALNQRLKTLHNTLNID